MTIPALPSGCRIIDFTMRGDERGSLIALEAGRDVPFDLKRAYYIFGTQEGVSRGFHAHKCLQQLIVAVSGSCTILLDDGAEQTRVLLDRPDRGLTLPPMVWHEMHDFSPGCVLLVVADDHYDEADYLRDYADFLREVERRAA
ncbi:FdtA/QdtA family cupin domain-containing protein [Sphingomonas humi]|uniref:FdtA/QdtA family cupin domain-containing protein n=1 Tax=Sphingomonas humi TaxID=335630 RepID=A0ABP7SDC0_9SPHN